MPNKKKVTEMFNDIAGDYDLLNHILSAGVDRSWRRKAVKEALAGPDRRLILDLATGTGDFAIALARKCPADGLITGLDISSEMLAGCKAKIEKKKLTGKISLIQGDCENLPFETGSFDAATVAFGVRNFENLEKGISEMFRVLRPGGKAVILELSTPDNRFLKAVYGFYFHRILPLIGGLVSGDKAAYRYLPASVERFPRPDRFCGIMRDCGFSEVNAKALTFGICRMFVGKKSE